MGFVITQLTGGKPWAVFLVGAIGFLFLFLLIIVVMYPRRRD
jgi:hypothetical protein